MMTEPPLTEDERALVEKFIRWSDDATIYEKAGRIYAEIRSVYFNGHKVLIKNSYMHPGALCMWPSPAGYRVLEFVAEFFGDHAMAPRVELVTYGNTYDQRSRMLLWCYGVPVRERDWMVIAGPLMLMALRHGLNVSAPAKVETETQ